MPPALEELPRSGLWKRLLIGAVLVVGASATATAVAAFHEVDKVVGVFKPRHINVRGLQKVPPGKPQTIMLLGSDKRPKGERAKEGADAGGRSDTIILARLDPDHGPKLMSLPRDLKVRIPGHGVGKLNSAYETGGPQLMLKTVKQTTGLSIQHVVNIDFRGFYTAVNAIGCIYSDVDRRYFNDSAQYAYINIKPGYQRLCGREALQYARFRHEDSDLVRGARQQGLLRDAKQQLGTGGLISDRDRLYKIFGRYTQSDIHSRQDVLSIGKLALGSAGQPIESVPVSGRETTGDEARGIPAYVVVSRAGMAKLRSNFLGDDDTGAKPKRKRRSGGGGGLEKAPAPGEDQAIQAVRAGAGGQLPVYYPTVRTTGSLFAGPPRVYKIGAPGGRAEKAYRMVIKRGLLGEYYGVQGTTWKNPPILAGPHEDRTVGGRKLELHYEGNRVRVVSWRTKKATYWVSNTLLESLSEQQMLAIARSARRL